MQRLNGVLQRRPIRIFQNIRTNLDNVVRSHAQKIPVECGVMQSAQSQAIGDDGLARRLVIRDDMGCV